MSSRVEKYMGKYIDYYKTLQVHQDADQRMIEAAYRCLSKQYHPDINNNGESAEHMKSINAAYSVLGDKNRRKAYHSEWLRSGGGSKSRAFILAGSGPGIELAGAVLDEFFRDTIKENWDEAYKKLTESDRLNVPRRDFADWKQAVCQLYKLVNFEIKYESNYENCEYGGLVYTEIIEFYVDLTVMDITTGEMSKEYAKKYMAYKEQAWKLCLGYTDLGPVIQKFKNRSAEKTRAYSREKTGVPHYFEMATQAQRELYRSQRYGNPLALLLLVVEPVATRGAIPSEEHLQECLSAVGWLIHDNIRNTDVVGRYGENAFAVFLTETKLEQGETVLKKLVKASLDDEGICYVLYGIAEDCTYGGRVEKILEAAFEKAAPDSVKNELNYFL